MVVCLNVNCIIHNYCIIRCKKKVEAEAGEEAEAEAEAEEEVAVGKQLLLLVVSI